MICLVQLLYAERWPKRPVLRCEDCFFEESCHKAKDMKESQKRSETAQKAFDDMMEHPIEKLDEVVSVGLYDIEEIHENCTVQVLKNSVTGEISIGWWENE